MENELFIQTFKQVCFKRIRLMHCKVLLKCSSNKKEYCLGRIFFYGNFIFVLISLLNVFTPFLIKCLNFVVLCIEHDLDERKSLFTKRGYNKDILDQHFLKVRKTHRQKKFTEKTKEKRHWQSSISHHL